MAIIDNSKEIYPRKNNYYAAYAYSIPDQKTNKQQ